MNIKAESLFILTSGFAKSCVQVTEDKTLPISVMANNIHRYFEKRKFHYNKKDSKTIGKYITEIIEPKLKQLEDLHEGKTSPQILLVLAVDQLVNEYKHITSRVNFSHFDISKMIDEIYSVDRYKEYIKSHSDFISNI